ncbi:MAG: zinc ribbon domain-containing protein [Porticoccaceae bacterium]|nr:zinc ribbon domain-containing protein [Pseudomonadales bacterium]MCP5173284.1 zinc ribbon domain-containing protein [Pseudomonadales bacterium]
MPIYEYKCQSCSHVLEKLQKISDAPLVDCPECGKAELKKQVTAGAFRLSGGGWYETDFKTGSKKNLAGDGAAKETPSAKSDSSVGKDNAGKGGATENKGSKAATVKAE